MSFGYDNANRRTSLTLPNGVIMSPAAGEAAAAAIGGGIGGAYGNAVTQAVNMENGAQNGVNASDLVNAGTIGLACGPAGDAGATICGGIVDGYTRSHTTAGRKN